jgi:predicted ATPase
VTHRLVGGYFNCSSMGKVPPHGMPQEQEAFQVLKESGARCRLGAAAQLTPMVGRTPELAQLMSLWHEAIQGTRHVVLIQGDAGIGKSRLLLAMKERLAGTPHVVRDVLCSPEYLQTPFQPIIAMLEIVFGFNQGDTPELKSVKLRQYLQTQDPATATKTIPLFAALLFLPSAEQISDVPVDTRKAQTITILLDLFQALASKQPTLLVVEDAHWMDASSLEFLSQLVTRKNRVRFLVAITARANFCAPWHNTQVTTINLYPLVPMEIEAILAWRGADMANAMRLRIVERADGVPLFAEEMANMVNLDQAANVPETLYDLLAARLDHMGEAKFTAQLASTLGREFDLNLLVKIFPHGTDALARTLNALDASGLIVNGLGADRKFKHSLIQEVAYQSQTKADRQAVHLLIAQVLQRDFCELVANQPELLARHLSDGGSTYQAIKYWLKAGQLGIERSAYLEAIEDFNSGLALLPHLLVDKERKSLALALHIGMESALVGAKEKRPTEAERVFPFPAVV